MYENIKPCPSPGPEGPFVCSPRKKLSSWVPQEEPKELQVGQDQTKPGSEWGVLPSRVPAAPEELQQQGSAKETEDLQGRQQNPGTVECLAPKRCQVMSVTIGREGTA